MTRNWFGNGTTGVAAWWRAPSRIAVITRWPIWSGRSREFTLITQNVDDLHEQAGSRNVIKLHGDIWQVRCLSCERAWIDTRPTIAELPPRCAMRRPAAARRGLVRGGIAAGRMGSAEKAARKADLFLVIGTSAVVYPAAGLVRVAKCSGAKVVEINLAETVITSQIDEFLPGPCGELLPKLIA